jgi:hypothetical protein
LVYFVKFEDSLREAGSIAGSELKIMVRGGCVPQARTVGRFHDVASEETRWSSAEGKSIGSLVERNPVR